MAPSPLRILFLTNYYPPHELGGQGRSCLDVVQGLSARGHACLVLTSMQGLDNRPLVEGGVHRRLFLEMDDRPLRHMVTFFTARKQREAHNLEVLEETLAGFSPDVLFVWGMWNLSRSLPHHGERLLHGRVAYRFAEYWPTLPSQHAMYWQAPPRSPLTWLPKKLLAGIALQRLQREGPPPELKFEHAMCVSAGTRRVLVEGGVAVSHAKIIYTGLDLEAFHPAANTPEAPAADRINLLYAGRVTAEKGVESLIRALAECGEAGIPAVRLKIAGPGRPAYIESLRALARELGVADRVSFLGRLLAEDMPELMRACDILVVPSIWPEPFARVVLEGMASGIVVVGTDIGGTGEIIESGRNGLLYPPGDAGALARHLRDLAADPERRRRLSAAGRETVLERFTRAAMLDAIEAFLREAAGAAA